MTHFGKITPFPKGFHDSSIENSSAAQKPADPKEEYIDPTASAEIAELVMGNLSQQVAARNVSPVHSDGKTDGKGGYTVSVHPKELGVERWSKEVTPQEVTRKAVEKALDDFGIKDENLRKQALSKLGHNELFFELGAEKTRKTIKTGDFGERDLMLVSTNKLGGVDIRFDAEQVNWLKGLAKLDKVNELANNARVDQPIKTETAMIGSAAVLSLPKTIELPKLAARPLLVLGAEAALPAAVIGTQIGAITWTADQIATNAHRKWEQQTRADALPLPPAIITNKAEDATKPETTVADKTKPQAQPIPDEKDLPKGELTVRPKAEPRTPTKADQPTAPTIENVPPAYKPNQPNSPQVDPSKVIAPVIGATTASIGKITVDAITETTKTQNIQAVEYGSTELSRAAIEYRKDENITGGQNIAVFKYLDKDGNVKLKALSSHDNVHSEKWLDVWRQEQGLPAENIIEIYTEREPCSLPMPQQCDRLLKEKYSHAKITYSFEYGKSAESRKEGTKALKKAVKEIFKDGIN